MKNHNKHYQKLTQEKRYQISVLCKTGMKQTAIAEAVGVSNSTISRELKRNSTQTGYAPEIAHIQSVTRRVSAAKASKRDPATDAIIQESLALGWSPAAISARMDVECPKPSRLSHTTIYRRIEKNCKQGGMLYTRLPRFGKKRWKGGKRYRKAGVAIIPPLIVWT